MIRKKGRVEECSSSLCMSGSAAGGGGGVAGGRMRDRVDIGMDGFQYG